MKTWTSEATYFIGGSLSNGGLPKSKYIKHLISFYRCLSSYRNGVDVGRYRTAAGYHQVMLSARELAPQLPEKARTWVNERLQFTHGYGLVMNFVSKKSPEGLPDYIIENIPPESLYNLKVVQPAI